MGNKYKLINKSIIISLILLILVSSCRKRERINHYLINPITKKALEENGFYKYSYTDTIDDEDKINDTVQYIVRYEMFTNVKPEKNNQGYIYPTQLGHFYREDSIKKRKNINYLQNDLNNRIIAYLFRDDKLFYKFIKVYNQNNFQKEIPDLTSDKKIIKYYDSLKIKIVPLQNPIKNDYITRFKIDTYNARIYYSETDKSYEININYISNYYHDILDDWYSGCINNSRYYL
jgi:hypothetical protein